MLQDLCLSALCFLDSYQSVSELYGLSVFGGDFTYDSATWRGYLVHYFHCFDDEYGLPFFDFSSDLHEWRGFWFRREVYGTDDGSCYDDSVFTNLLCLCCILRRCGLLSGLCIWICLNALQRLSLLVMNIFFAALYGNARVFIPDGYFAQVVFL